MNSKILKVLRALDELNNSSQLVIRNSELKTYEQLVLDLKLVSPEEQAILNFILTYAVKSELVCPNSISEFISTLSKTFQSKTIDNNINVNSLSPTIVSDPLTWQNLVQSCTQFLADATLAKLFVTAVELAGLHGRIFIERSANDKSSVELTQGYSFAVTTNSVSKKTLVDVHVIAIEGYVETVSELNALFEELASTKEVCVIFARGFTEDIYSTVQTNNARGVFNVSLFVVPFELQGINMINDISIAAGATLVSSNMGHLISTTTLSRAGFFKKISIVPGTVTCINNKTAKAVQEQLQRLLQKSQEAEVDDIRKLIDARIKTLQAASVVIRLPDDKEFIRKSLLLDKAFRLSKSLINYGFYEGKPAVNLLAKKLASECYKQLSNVGFIVTTD